MRAAAALPVTRATPQWPSDVSGLGVEMRDRPAGNPSRADDVDAGQHSGTVERQHVASELKTGAGPRLFGTLIWRKTRGG